MSSTPLRLHPEAATAYAALLRDLDDLAARGHLAPCAKRPHLWVSESREDRQAAAHACQSCPALATCEAYASALPERFGTWAARDRTSRRHDHDQEADQ